MEFIACPNFDNESFRKPITTIVIHWFGIGTIDSAISRFKNPDAKASAHYLISDNRVVQMVEEKCVAWHAGVYAVNQKSIGIEHDATTTKNMSDETYKTSANLIREICKRYAIPLDREHIIGHKEVPYATQCPGTIDIDRLISLAKEAPVEDQIEKLTNELIDMRQSRDKWKRDFEELEDKYEKNMAEKNEHIDSLQKTLSETNQNLTAMTKNYNDLSIKAKSLEDDIEKYKKIQADDLVREGEYLDKIDELETEVEKLEGDLDKKLSELPRIKLLLALIWR